MNSSCAENMNQGSNNQSKEDIDMSNEGILSPNTKIQNVKNKYLPNEMEEIDEESIESDLTSSIASKRLLAGRQNRHQAK
jgi:hypothetical protein